MPLTVTKTLARFEDVCTVEEALPLLEFLKTQDHAKADLSRCTYLHSALLQLLYMAKAEIVALPEDPLLARWVDRLLLVPAQPDLRQDTQAIQ
jgi:nicotinic acid phosphoribosyltransferase